MVDLSTRYLGLPLRSPIVASSSPLTASADSARRLVDAGAAAIVLPSLFEEEIRPHGPDEVATYADAGNFYLDRLETMKTQSAVPVLASLNAGAPGSWARYSRWLVDAGADALELNLYHVAADSRRTAADQEEADLEVVSAVRAEVPIPLAVKLSPYYSATANVAARFVEAGVDGLILFNRFYSPDIDPETFGVTPRLELSQPWELRLPLRWIAILRGQLPEEVSLAATSGVSAGAHVVKALIAGADVTTIASALLRYGPSHLANIEAELRSWLTQHDYASVDALREAASRARASDREAAAALERANYVTELRSWSNIGM